MKCKKITASTALNSVQTSHILSSCDKIVDNFFIIIKCSGPILRNKQQLIDWFEGRLVTSAETYDIRRVVAFEDDRWLSLDQYPQKSGWDMAHIFCNDLSHSCYVICHFFSTIPMKYSLFHTLWWWLYGSLLLCNLTLNVLGDLPLN